MVSDNGRPGLVAGCRNIPSFINAQPLVRAVFDAGRCSRTFIFPNISGAGIDKSFIYLEVAVSAGSGNLKYMRRRGILIIAPICLSKLRKRRAYFGLSIKPIVSGAKSEFNQIQLIFLFQCLGS